MELQGPIQIDPGDPKAQPPHGQQQFRTGAAVAQAATDHRIGFGLLHQTFQLAPAHRFGPRLPSPCQRPGDLAIGL